LLNILRTADVNNVVLLSYGRPSSAVAELLLLHTGWDGRYEVSTVRSVLPFLCFYQI